MRYWISLSLLLLATAPWSVAQQPAPSATPAPQAAASPAASASSDKDDPQIEIPVPLNVPVQGVKIPHYGSDGSLQMLFTATTATKTDDDHVEFKNLWIGAYNTDGSKFDVQLPESVLNLKTRVLKGDSGVLISRDDFKIEGDAVEFYIKSRRGLITGNVKMTIYNTDKLISK